MNSFSLSIKSLMLCCQNMLTYNNANREFTSRVPQNCSLHKKPENIAWLLSSGTLLWRCSQCPRNQERDIVQSHSMAQLMQLENALTEKITTIIGRIQSVTEAAKENIHYLFGALSQFNKLTNQALSRQDENTLAEYTNFISGLEQGLTTLFSFMNKSYSTRLSTSLTNLRKKQEVVGKLEKYEKECFQAKAKQARFFLRKMQAKPSEMNVFYDQIQLILEKLFTGVNIFPNERIKIRETNGENDRLLIRSPSNPFERSSSKDRQVEALKKETKSKQTERGFAQLSDYGLTQQFSKSEMENLKYQESKSLEIIDELKNYIKTMQFKILQITKLNNDLVAEKGELASILDQLVAQPTNKGQTLFKKASRVKEKYLQYEKSCWTLEEKMVDYEENINTLKAQLKKREIEPTLFKETYDQSLIDIEDKHRKEIEGIQKKFKEDRRKFEEAVSQHQLALNQRISERDNLNAAKAKLEADLIKTREDLARVRKLFQMQSDTEKALTKDLLEANTNHTKIIAQLTTAHENSEAKNHKYEGKIEELVETIRKLEKNSKKPVLSNSLTQTEIDQRAEALSNLESELATAKKTLLLQQQDSTEKLRLLDEENNKKQSLIDDKESEQAKVYDRYFGAVGSVKWLLRLLLRLTKELKITTLEPAKMEELLTENQKDPKWLEIFISSRPTIQQLGNTIMQSYREVVLKYEKSQGVCIASKTLEGKLRENEQQIKSLQQRKTKLQQHAQQLTTSLIRAFQLLEHSRCSLKQLEYNYASLERLASLWIARFETSWRLTVLATGNAFQELLKSLEPTVFDTAGSQQVVSELLLMSGERDSRLERFADSVQQNVQRIFQRSYILQQEATIVELPPTLTTQKSGVMENFWSKILTAQQKQWLLMQLQQQAKTEVTRIQLMYFASQHQFQTASYHRVCDSLSNLLTIIQTKKGWVLGGFTDLPMGDKSKPSNCSFIFSVNRERVMPLKPGRTATQNEYSYGPVFGSENDIRVDRDSVSTNYHVLKATYQRVEVEGVPNKEVLMGGMLEDLVEYEVFEVGFNKPVE